MKKVIIVFLLIVVIGVPVFSDYPKVALVLSGGGARGLAHVPIIEALERHSIPVDIVLGTSMGAFVGGVYAAGYSPADMYNLIESYDMIETLAVISLPPLKYDLIPFQAWRYNLFNLDFDKEGVSLPSSIISDQQILNVLNNSLSKVSYIEDFDNLSIPFRSIGANIISGERIIFDKGSLVGAIRSSISIPILFSPYKIDGQLVVDGGVVDNMPVALAKEMGYDIVIAVDVNSSDYDVENKDLETIAGMFYQLVVVITRNTIVEQRKMADLLVDIPLGDLGVLDFHKSEEIIRIGKEVANSLDDQFATLAKEISSKRELHKRDPNRVGSYFEQKDIHISAIKQHLIDGDKIELNLNLSKRYLDKIFDNDLKEKLEGELNKIREKKGYATLTYQLSDVELKPSGEVCGTLEIIAIPYNKKRSVISAAAYGSTSLLFNRKGDSFLSFAPELKINYAYYLPFVTLEVDASNSDTFNLGASFTFKIKDHLEIKGSSRFHTGGIHPANLRNTPKGLTSRDRSINNTVTVQYTLEEKFLVGTEGEFDFLWYGDETLGGGFIPTVSVFATYNTLPFGFSPRSGVRADVKFSSELGSTFKWRFQSDFSTSIPVGPKDTISVALKGGAVDTSYPQKKTLFDIGTTKGIATYSSSSMVNNFILMKVSHYHYFSENPIAVSLNSSISGSVRGTLFNDSPYSLNQIKFNNWDLSASVGLALSFASIDLLVGFAIDKDLRTAIFVEVI